MRVFLCLRSTRVFSLMDFSRNVVTRQRKVKKLELNTQTEILQFDFECHLGYMELNLI